MPLAGVDAQLDVAPGGPHRVGHRLGLLERHDPVVGALEQQQLAVQPVDVVDGGALAVDRLTLRPGGDEPVEVARLELVRLGRERGQVGDAEQAGPGGEGAAGRHGAQHGIPAGAAAADGEPGGVDPTGEGQGHGAR